MLRKLASVSPAPRVKARRVRLQRKSPRHRNRPYARVEKTIRSIRRRVATELWDLISPTSTRAAADAALAIGKSKRLVRRLAIERSPRRSSRLKTLLFSRMGAIIAILYGFYLLLSLIMALPILALAFLQDLHELILFRLRKAFATSR